MKKTSKILIVILTMMLLIGVLAVATSASEDVGGDIEGKFVVAGVGYETWEAAVSAANNVHTIYLNEDWTLSGGITLSGESTNVKVNLNGKTVSVTDGSMLFNVHTGAKLTVTGSGVLNNNGLVLIGGSTSGVVTIDATGEGIVINNNATSGDVNTLRFQSYSTLNISGKIVVNTNGKTANRAIINTADSKKQTVNLNIKNADIFFATPTVAGAPAGKVLYTQYSNVNIEDSRLEGVYSYVVYAVTGGSVTIAPHIINVGSGSSASYVWNPNTLEEAKKTLKINITENYTVKNSVISSIKDTGYEGNISGSIMYFAGATKADFTNCEFYGHYRAIHGRQSNDSWNNIATKTADASQLTFIDCHIRPCEGGTIPYLFCYGPNFRFIGGSISGVSTLANCQPHYIELTDDNGNPTGQWFGGYVDNVLGISGLKGHDMVISTAWQNATSYNPDSVIKGALPTPVTLVIGGKSQTFTTGYFSDMDKYNSYMSVDSGSTWKNYIHATVDGSNIKSTGDYSNEIGGSAVGTYPFKDVGGANFLSGAAMSVVGLNKKGEANGYVKFSNASTTSSKYTYFQTPTGGAGDIINTDAFVVEFDASTDTAAFLRTSFSFQGRGKHPRFDANGNYLGYSNGKFAANAMDYAPSVTAEITAANTVALGSVSKPISTTAGDWTRVTFIIDFEDTGVKEDITVPAYTLNGSTFEAVSGKTATIKATKLTKYSIYLYVDGEYLTKHDYDLSTIGYNGYIPAGYEANYYIDGIRIFFTDNANVDETTCFDNVRVSKYTDKDNVDLGFLDEEGNPVASLAGLDHFMTMPDNMALPDTTVAEVDGVKYETEAEVIAAIKDGSVVEIFRDIETPINVDAILENLGLETISFKIITGENDIAGVISKNHKLVDYSGVFGGYLVTPAKADEIYNIYLRDDIFGISEKYSSVAEGTLYPEIDFTVEGEKAYDGMLWTILGWEDSLGRNVASAYYVNADFEIVFVPEYDSKAYYYEITVNGSSKYVTELIIGDDEAAELAAGEAYVILWRDVALESSINVNGSLEFDLNGYQLTVNGGEGLNVFEVPSGAKLNLYSSREGAKIEALGNATLVSALYDRFDGSDADINLSGFAISTAKLVDYRDTYVHEPEFGEDVYEYIGKLNLNISGLSILHNGASSDAIMTSSAPVEIKAENVSYEGAAPVISASSDARATVNASFSDSSFVSSQNPIAATGAGKVVSLDACYVDAPLAAVGGERIIIGAGCSFSLESEALAASGLEIGADLVIAKADAGAIKSYVDAAENLALITWFDSKGNPIGAPNYNAPFGNIVEIYTYDEALEKVGHLVYNDWYNVTYAGWDIPADFVLTAGSFNVYPKWNEMEASVNCLKMDLVAYTYFKLNFYLPTEALPEGVELYGIYRPCGCHGTHDHKRDPNYRMIDGEWYVLLETATAQIDGASYNTYTVYPGASDASEPEYKIAFAVNGELLVDTVKCGVPTYAETAMKGIMKEGVTADDLSEEEKLLASLIMNMVRYANESYKLASGNVRGAAKYEALLESYSEFLVDYDDISFSEAEKNVDVSGLSEYMEGVSFIFGAYQPKFVFKYRDTALNALVKPETTDGRIYTWPEGNIGIFTLIYHERYDGTKSISYIAPHLAYNGDTYVEPDIVSGAWGAMTEAYATTVDMSVRDATGIINVAVYTPDGTVVSGTYSLAAYIEYLKVSTAEAAEIAANAKAIAEDAAIKAAIAAEEALKPENAALKDKYEELRDDHEERKLEYEAIYAKNEKIRIENEAFMEASLSLYAFSLASQSYASVIQE